jgi:hypothetical protein
MQPWLPLVLGCALLAGCTSTLSGRGSLDAHHGPPASSGPTGHVALARIPLRRSDLPNGWTGHKHQSDKAGNNAFDQKFADCVGAVGGLGAVQSVDGPDFDNGLAEISSSATRYASQQQVDKDVSILTGPRAESCLNTALRDMLEKNLPNNADVGSVDIAITSGSAGGPHNVVATATGSITLTENAQTIRLYFDLAFITGPRIEADVDFFNIGTRVDPSLQQQLIAVVARRAANA